MKNGNENKNTNEEKRNGITGKEKLEIQEGMKKSQRKEKRERD